MHQTKFGAAIPFACLLCAACSIFGVRTMANTIPTQPASGDYHAGGGAVSHWTIDSSHMLSWAGRPYSPAGGIFQPRCMADASSDTEANWTADEANLATLKAHGVTQIVLEAGSATGPDVPIDAIAPGTLQRVIDYLNANGFTYGLDINGFPAGSLDATTVNPAIYRAPDPDMNTTVTFRAIAGISGARYFIASTRDGTVMSTGDASLSGESDASVATGEFGGPNSVLLLYPTRRFGDNTIEGRHCPDLWGKADDVRDDLIVYLNRIKFGPGLRFFLDPIRDDLGYYGAAAAGMVPTSAAYRQQFATWLAERYDDRLPVLERAWAITNDDLPDFQTAARSIPLWYQLKGLQSLYDPQTKALFDVNAANSRIWADIKAFQDDSMRSSMNALAIALRNGVADVPVVYRWSRAGAATLESSADGYDGLMVDSPLHGNELADEAIGYALSDVQHARRTQWLLAELTPPNPVSTLRNSRAPVGLGSQTALASDSGLIGELGVHGFYIDALHGNSESDIDLLDAPSDQLDWLHAAALEQSGPGASAGGSPQILYYPTTLALPGAQIQQLPCGAWWLPAAFDSVALDLGPGVEGYSIDTESGTQYVMYSTSNAVQTLSFPLPHVDKGAKPQKPVCVNALGDPVKFSVNKGALSVAVGSDPVVIAGMSALPLPKNAMEDEMAEVQKLIALGKKDGAPVDVFSQRVYYIQNNPLLDSPEASTADYDLLRLLDAQLKLFVSPYVWIEAEAPVTQSFGGVIASPDASGGAYLWLDRDHAPPKGTAYSARYQFHVHVPGDYDIWISTAPAPGDSAQAYASPFSIGIDDGQSLLADSFATVGLPYGSLARSGSAIAGQFAWRRFTTVHLNAGDHSLTVTVDSPAPATGRWTLGIDAICLSRGDFHPDGTIKPSF